MPKKYKNWLMCIIDVYSQSNLGHFLRHNVFCVIERLQNNEHMETLLNYNKMAIKTGVDYEMGFYNLKNI